MSLSYKKNIISSMITQYGNTLLGFFSSIIITRILAGYGRGEMALYTNFISLTVLFFGFSLTTGIVYFVASQKMAPVRILQLALAYFGAASVIVLAMLLLLAKFNKLGYVLPETGHNIIIYLICIVGFFLNSINSIFTGIFNGLKKIRLANTISLTINGLSLVVMIAIFAGKIHLQVNAFLLVVVVQLFFQLLQFVLLIYYLNFKSNDAGSYSPHVSLKNNFISLFRFSTLIYATNLLTFFTYKLDVWIVNYYHGKTELGIYSLAVTLAQMVWLLPNAIAFVNLSEVSGKSESSRSLDLTVSSYKLAFYSTVFISIFFYFFCLFFVPVLYGKEFSEVPYYLLLLFIGVVPFSPITIISSYLAGINRFRHNFYAAFVGVALCIILDLTLIPRLGVTGACIASSVSYLAIFIYLTAYFKISSGILYKDLFHFTSQERNRILSFLKLNQSKK